MKKAKELDTITIDEVIYELADLPEAARAQIANIQFSDKQILQLQNEWAVANTARVGYLRAFQAELPMVNELDG